MGERAVSFCEGCPFANGVGEVGGCNVEGFEARDPNPGFELSFTDASDPERSTATIHAVVYDGVDSSMPEATADGVLAQVEACPRPVQVTVKRLGGLAGTKTVTRCGAFPEQKPDHILVAAQDSGWFNEADFL